MQHLEPTDLSDEELAAFALAADPDTVVAADAVPLGSGLSFGLPAAYMPPVAAGTLPRSRVRTIAALVVIGAFLAITGLGFCATYGLLVFA